MNKLRTILLQLLVLISCMTGFAQKHVRVALDPAVDSMGTLLYERTGVKANLTLSSANRRNNNLDLVFSQELSDWHWNRELVDWFTHTLPTLFPEEYAKYKVTSVKTGDNVTLEDLITPELDNDGRPKHYKFNKNVSDPRMDYPLVSRTGAPEYQKGLSGRHIALWQSHGYYYDNGEDRWTWQRSPNFGSTEDLLTQSFVLPYLIPMLENAGAYIITPRERDTNTDEVIIDNDPFADSTARRHGVYVETGEWKNAGQGFADAMREYTGKQNPFKMGTVRTAPVSRTDKSSARSEYRFDADGSYAVYVSYKSEKNSTRAAHYIVDHAGGASEFYINQTMGGGTWIYLGTFEFSGNGRVIVDNVTKPELRGELSRVVTTDAVKIGGGMGKVARGGKVSGMPSFIEGALYWEQFAGVDSTITAQWDGDYTQDFASRGAWVESLKKDKGIPVDLSFAFHTDAGATPNDSVVGTLSIYTLMADGKRKYSDGRDRMLGREFADMVQTQVVNDIRADFDSAWIRRELWNRSYSESRTTDVPGMILELLAHQNFSDMKYALDPNFRFTVSRAVYKGMLKFLSNTYGVLYEVQPLPVNSFSAVLDEKGKKAVLRWKDTDDPKEPTARASSYVLSTRVDDGVFSRPAPVEVKRRGEWLETEVAVSQGKLYSFKVSAVNEGGMSFPSEVLCVGVPAASAGGKKALVVNNFDRLAPPSWFDYPSYGGFENRADAGVDYISQINFGGDMFEFRREKEWVSNDVPGFGGSYMNRAGGVWAGNTFDYVSIHAKALMAAGYSVVSSSRPAFESDGAVSEGAGLVDLICGKQLTTPVGKGWERPDRYQVWTKGLRDRLSEVSAKGTNLLVSGGNIGFDITDSAYPVSKDSSEVEASKTFAADILGWKYRSGHSTKSGKVNSDSGYGFSFPVERNSEIYWVETPDAIQPAARKSKIIMRYSDTGLPAAVEFSPGTYKAVSFGFPLEIIREEGTLERIITEYFN